MKVLSEEEIDERVIIKKLYNTSRNELMIQDRLWIKQSLQKQINALEALRKLSPKLYEAAIQRSDEFLPLNFQGPSLTPPIKDYESPDGEYEDLSTNWNAIEQQRLAIEVREQAKKKKAKIAATKK